MALLVELVGAPGTGKTSVAGALDGLRVGGRTVRPAADLARPPRRGLPRGLARRLAADEDPRRLRRALDDRAAEWEALLRLVLADRSGDPRPPALRLEALDWTRRTLAAVALVRAVPAGLFVLDEGPLQRITAVLGPTPVPADARRYASLVPPADLVLHLTADPATLARRLMARAATGRVNARHAGLDVEAVADSVRADAELLSVAVGTVAAAGVPVVAVDATDVAGAVAAARAAVRARLGRPSAATATA